MTRYIALIDGEAGAYGAAFPDCPGCTAMGATMDDTIRNAREALREWMADSLASGVPAPAPRPAAAILASLNADGNGLLALAIGPEDWTSHPLEVRRSIPLPRIARVASTGGSTLAVTWTDGGTDRVNLAGWIGTGGELLAPLASAVVFEDVRLGDYGAFVQWGPEDGDLAIDAYHLHQLAAEQRAFTPSDLIAWQARTGLSNQEAAEFLGLGLSTWNAYKAGATIPNPVAMTCRAALRDPILLQAHYRPRKAGRPRADGNCLKELFRTRTTRSTTID